MITKQTNIMETQITIGAFNEMVQRRYRCNLERTNRCVGGTDHAPIIEVTLTLPDGKTFTATDSNKTVAADNTATNAVEKLGW